MLTRREQEVSRLRQQGFTQTQVAKRLKITQAAVSSFETNAKRKIADAKETLEAAKKLGLKPEALP